MNADRKTDRATRHSPKPTGTPPTRTLVLHPVQRQRAAAADRRRSPEAALAEAVALCAAIHLDVVEARLVPLSRPSPSMLFGTGTVAELAALVAGDEEEGRAPIGLVVVDHALGPVQQRNLEQKLKAKVIDRTGLILEIFGARARTREGTLQVELAALEYQRSRLVRSWTHLERQRGGFGFLGGPGESQLEIDRRIIGERIAKLEKALEGVKRTRGLHRSARAKVPYPTVALVGYTNAGKSTLFNHLAAAGVMSADLLFATLDPTMRQVVLPSGRRIILSDTVGFISDLPTHLVAAFRATLEEVTGADIVLHVRDAAHPDSAAQRADVLGVLADLDIEEDDPRLIEVLNKVDLLPAEERDALLARNEGAEAGLMPSLPHAVSAVTGAGCASLLARLDAKLRAVHGVTELAVELSDGAALAFLYRRGAVLERHDDERFAHLRLGLDPIDRARLESQFHYRPTEAPAFRDAAE